MIPLLDQLPTQLKIEVEKVSTLKELEALKIKFLGKKGIVHALMEELRQCSVEQKPALGKKINEFKQHVHEVIENQWTILSEVALEEQLRQEKIDVTLPSHLPVKGGTHVITKILDRALDILKEMGFAVVSSPHIETEHYNFEALHFPEDHPARDLQDTYYLSKSWLLRTHVTAVQARILEKSSPPIRVVSAGKCFRNEEVCARSHVAFHQIDGFYVDENVSFCSLLYTLELFLKKMFSADLQVRFRPSYFPFVEPGLEADISCTLCSGTGCPICKHTGWLEVLGAGMIHPHVLAAAGLDSEKYTGFAWGMGIDRLALLLHSIPDLRLFHQNDLRFLRQF